MLNPKGRSKSLPEWFQASGEGCLRTLMAVAAGELEDRNWSQLDAVDAVITRIFGTPPKAPEDRESRENSVEALLMALMVQPKSKE